MQRQEVLIRGMGIDRVGRLGAIVGECCFVALLHRLRQPVVEFLGPRLRLGRLAAAHQRPQIVRGTAAAHHQDVLLAQRAELASQRDVVRRALLGLHRELEDRDVGLGPAQHRRHPGAVVQPSMRVMRRAGELGHALGQFRRAGSGVAEAVERFGKTVEIVDGLGPVRQRHGRHVGIPMGRDRDDRLGPRQHLSQRREEGTRRHVLQDQRRRAVRDEDGGHGHRFIPHATRVSLCAIRAGAQTGTWEGQ